MDLYTFRIVNPCGQDGRLVTSLRSILNRDVTRKEVEKILLDQAEETFGERFLFGEELIL